MALNRTLKRTLITLTIIAAIPFTCCGIPIGLSELFAPTRWKYFKEYQPPRSSRGNFQLDGIDFFMTILGKNDYFNNQFEYVAQRTITVYSKRMNSDDANVKLLDITINSSTEGVLYSKTQFPSPHEFVFDTPSGDHAFAEWKSPTTIETNLPSGEIITVILLFEITRNKTVTTHTLKVVFTPESRRDPYHWMPSV